MIFGPQKSKNCKSQVFGSGLESFEWNSEFWNFNFLTSYLRKTSTFFSFFKIASSEKSKTLNPPVRKNYSRLLQNGFLNVPPNSKSLKKYQFLFPIWSLNKIDFWNPWFSLKINENPLKINIKWVWSRFFLHFFHNRKTTTNSAQKHFSNHI